MVKLWSSIKFFKLKVKDHSQGSMVKNVGTDVKVLSHGIHMWNMKALYLTVQKLWSRLEF